jgi:hypothetical protein
MISDRADIRSGDVVTTRNLRGFVEIVRKVVILREMIERSTGENSELDVRAGDYFDCGSYRPVAACDNDAGDAIFGGFRDRAGQLARWNIVYIEKARALESIAGLL